jgi:hypothetical protein
MSKTSERSESVQFTREAKLGLANDSYSRSFDRSTMNKWCTVLPQMTVLHKVEELVERKPV